MAMKCYKLPHRPKRAKLIQITILFISLGAWLFDLYQEMYEVREKKTSKKKPRGLKAMENMEGDSEHDSLAHKRGCDKLQRTLAAKNLLFSAKNVFGKSAHHHRRQHFSSTIGDISYPPSSSAKKMQESKPKYYTRRSHLHSSIARRTISYVYSPFLLTTLAGNISPKSIVVAYSS
ncbi:Uncharacterized protein Fot_05760 [Forsythia ovata]|uniref:Uncharacterized protein n=1 Tax=Forsythia ovata TaxID=205694 RepID=A0ABD1WRC6_9LAMI